VKPSDRAWCTLAAGVIVYDAFARDGQTLSEGAQTHRRAQPVTTLLIIAGVAVHLSGLVPGRFDPLHWLLLLKCFLIVKCKARRNMSRFGGVT
jgi:putative exporter of polyketide antibiotics